MQTGFPTYPRVVAAWAVFLCCALAVHADQFGLFTYVEYDTTIEITDYPTDATGDLIIPSEIVGKPVTSIGNKAFFECSSLTNVTIPNSVTSIERSAFSRCSDLTSVTIPDSVTTIGRGAFNECTSLTDLTIPDSVTSIGDYVFSECFNLNSVTIGDSVTSIGSYAF
ncbi:MAG: fibronectin type III domain-containing protein, partial [Chloroflexi bacterium]